MKNPVEKQYPETQTRKKSHSPPRLLQPWWGSLKPVYRWGLAFSLLLSVGACLTEALALPLPAQAQLTGYGFAPQTYQDGLNYGTGVYFAPSTFTLYTQPDEHAPKIAEFRWSRKTSSNRLAVTTGSGERGTLPADTVFISFYPSLDVAMMAVTGENGEGWVEVVYDQPHKKTGWVRLNLKESSPDSVKPKSKMTASDASPNASAQATTGATKEPLHFGIYQTWQEFMKLNAKANGIYWLGGVKEYNRSIRTSDSDDAKLIPVTIIRNLKVKHVRGNWLLVEVLDFENNTPIGWIRWRDDDGNLMVFPNINQQYHPIVTIPF